MVGKIKHVRQTRHQEAVKPETDPSDSLSHTFSSNNTTVLHTRTKEPHNLTQALAGFSFPSGIFSSTRISPDVLVQTLTFDPPVDRDTPAHTPAHTGPEEKKVQSKRDKRKERRERWLNKISSIKQAKEAAAAAARRQAMPVVGDMRPLADALPELSQLIAPVAAATATHRKSRKNKAPVKRPEPTDFSQMKQSQKRKLLQEESNRFSAAVKSLSAKPNPLADLGEQLRKRMKQEEEEPS